MHSQHDKASEDAGGAEDQVDNAQEGVLATHPGNSAEDDLLAALEGEDGVVVGDVEAVGALGQARGEVALTHAAVELAEGRQSSGAHPHNEVLVDEAGIVEVALVQHVGSMGPVGRLGCALEGGLQAAIDEFGVAELDVGVGPPGDASVVQGHGVEGAVGQVVEGEGVIEEAVGDGPAGGDGDALGVRAEGAALRGWVAQPRGVPAELQVVAGDAVAPVVLVVVGELVVEAHGPREALGQLEAQRAGAGPGPGPAGVGAAGAVVAAARRPGVVELQLADGGRGEVQPQPQRQAGQARAEEERQRRARRQQRLPGREALLGEGRVIRLVPGGRLRARHGAPLKRPGPPQSEPAPPAPAR
ncbi:hypothetical protein KIL84_005317 [Mauremys mutica]|uniref:Uncharacterized protein n=1 Tax=Mauremys mutica TaxID=74926 RepID=A0A9D4B5Q4_9SAUR|nr:hypothetical protein KIL84_005317 [Mauremys mutica]